MRKARHCNDNRAPNGFIAGPLAHFPLLGLEMSKKMLVLNRPKNRHRRVLIGRPW